MRAEFEDLRKEREAGNRSLAGCLGWGQRGRWGGEQMGAADENSRTAVAERSRLGVWLLFRFLWRLLSIEKGRLAAAFSIGLAGFEPTTS